MGFMERAMRIELTTEAWEAPILPLNYARLYISLYTFYYIFCSLTSILMCYLSIFKKMYDFAIMSGKEDGIFNFSSHYR